MNITWVREVSTWSYVWKEMMVSLEEETKQERDVQCQ